MNLAKIKAVANKALIAANPDYHAWSAEEQEIFRATMRDDAQYRVDAVLLSDLLGIQCTAENAREIWRDLPLSKLNTLNWAKLLTTGIGDAMITLNELMAENTSLLDFNTLYDYDYDDHLFQEAANKREINNYIERDYYAIRFSRWARLIINDQIYYATLYSQAGYLTQRLEDQGSDLIQTLIPHEYVDGKNHGKPEQGGFLWDVKLDAAGLEKQLDELNSRWRQYTQQRWLALSQQCTQSAPAVYTADKNEGDELHRNFIFNNESALKQVRWQHFLSDCEAIKSDYIELAKMEQQELAKAKSWLQATHQDIMTNFDPKGVKRKKKMKVVVAPRAFDGMGGDEDE